MVATFSYIDKNGFHIEWQQLTLLTIRCQIQKVADVPADKHRTFVASGSAPISDAQNAYDMAMSRLNDLLRRRYEIRSPGVVDEATQQDGGEQQARQLGDPEKT